jgi:hypothetical protein
MVMFSFFNDFHSSKYSNEFFLFPSLSFIRSKNSNFMGISIRWGYWGVVIGFRGKN